MCCRAFVPLAVALMAAAAAGAQAQPLPAAGGRVLEAADGDIVVVPADARVTVLTRTQAHARIVYVAARQTLLLFTDPPLAAAVPMPGAKGFRRWEVRGPWPLEARWEGPVTIDEYAPSGRGPLSLAIHTDRGTILVGPPHGEPVSLSLSPVAIVQFTSSSMRFGRGSFDEMEQAWLEGGDNAVAGGRPFAGHLRLSATSAAAVPGAVAGAVSGPPVGAVRVGGNIRPPAKVRSAEPIYPQAARDAGIQGVVIVELHIAADGAVSNARLLRSIPLLDQAALDAVRQWRYEPTLLNGAPVPVIMTATVNFSLSRP